MDDENEYINKMDDDEEEILSNTFTAAASVASQKKSQGEVLDDESYDAKLEDLIAKHEEIEDSINDNRKSMANYKDEMLSLKNDDFLQRVWNNLGDKKEYSDKNDYRNQRQSLLNDIIQGLSNENINSRKELNAIKRKIKEIGKGNEVILESSSLIAKDKSHLQGPLIKLMDELTIPLKYMLNMANKIDYLVQINDLHRRIGHEGEVKHCTKCLRLLQVNDVQNKLDDAEYESILQKPLELINKFQEKFKSLRDIALASISDLEQAVGHKSIWRGAIIGNSKISNDEQGTSSSLSSAASASTSVTTGDAEIDNVSRLPKLLIDGENVLSDERLNEEEKMYLRMGMIIRDAKQNIQSAMVSNLHKVVRNKSQGEVAYDVFTMGSMIKSFLFFDNLLYVTRELATQSGNISRSRKERILRKVDGIGLGDGKEVFFLESSICKTGSRDTHAKEDLLKIAIYLIRSYTEQNQSQRNRIALHLLEEDSKIILRAYTYIYYDGLRVLVNLGECIFPDSADEDSWKRWYAFQIASVMFITNATNDLKAIVFNQEQSNKMHISTTVSPIGKGNQDNTQKGSGSGKQSSKEDTKSKSKEYNQRGKKSSLEEELTISKLNDISFIIPLEPNWLSFGGPDEMNCDYLFNMCPCDMYYKYSTLSDNVMVGKLRDDTNSSTYPIYAVFKRPMNSERIARERNTCVRLGSIKNAENEDGFSHICKSICICDRHKQMVYEELNEIDWENDVRLQPLVIKNIIIDILKGVRVLHEADIAHCDIKPENIMWRNEDKKYVLCDFDASIFPSSVIGMKGRTIGTFGWSSLEDEDDESLNTPTKIDLMSIGVIITRMLSEEGRMMDWDDRWWMIDGHLQDCLKALEGNTKDNDVPESWINWEAEEMMAAKQIVNIARGFIAGKLDIDDAIDILQEELECSSSLSPPSPRFHSSSIHSLSASTPSSESKILKEVNANIQQPKSRSENTMKSTHQDIIMDKENSMYQNEIEQ